MRTNDKAWRQIEKGLGSVGRLRILFALASSELSSQTKYSLEKFTGLKPIDVRKHLKILTDTGWVKEYNYNPSVYTLNLDEPKAMFLTDFFKKMGCL
ncbi:hypothetical protein DRO66_09850 [Candidatus Bathyarchaeota archaeon]|jgi:DNA-binding transcriptional ArsR family regulator|nr:MAG: hypothetical protein DRO66_09850 [Candidatus Bathyarchaeota archaeon]